MKQIAEFTIIGRAGNIKTVGTTVRVNIASNYSFKDANGNRLDDGPRGGKFLPPGAVGFAGGFVT